MHDRHYFTLPSYVTDTCDWLCYIMRPCVHNLNSSETQLSSTKSVLHFFAVSTRKQISAIEGFEVSAFHLSGKSIDNYLWFVCILIVVFFQLPNHTGTCNYSCFLNTLMNGVSFPVKVSPIISFPYGDNFPYKFKNRCTNMA